MTEDNIRALLVSEYMKAMSLEQFGKIPEKYLEPVDKVIDLAVNLILENRNDS